MKTFFRSQGLWKTIEKGVVKEGPEDKMMEVRRMMLKLCLYSNKLWMIQCFIGL